MRVKRKNSDYVSKICKLIGCRPAVSNEAILATR